MNGVAHHKTRQIVSEIDIRLWAREQRRRWFARTCGAPLRKFALRSSMMFRLVIRDRRDSSAQSGYHGPVATWQ